MEDQKEELMQETAEAAEESAQLLSEETPEEMTETSAEAVRPLQEQELLDFVRQYPGLDPRSIPNSVWEAVRGGETLMNAYGRHELQQLRSDNRRMREQLGVLSSRAGSRENSLGSMRSSGSARAADGFLLGFDQA